MARPWRRPSCGPAAACCASSSCTGRSWPARWSARRSAQQQDSGAGDAARALHPNVKHIRGRHRLEHPTGWLRGAVRPDRLRERRGAGAGPVRSAGRVLGRAHESVRPGVRGSCRRVEPAGYGVRGQAARDARARVRRFRDPHPVPRRR